MNSEKQIEDKESAISLNINKIFGLLSHRYPFLLVDKVISITEKTPGKVVGRICKAKKNVTINEPFFEGHFPGNPVMPGVLILEAIAQTGALCCSAVEGDPQIEKIFFAGVDKVRFKHPVFPGDTLDLVVEMSKNKSFFYWGYGTALVEDKVVARADILAHITFKQ